MNELLRKMLGEMDATVSVKKTYYLYCQIVPEAKQSVRKGKASFFVPKEKLKYAKRLRDVFWPQWGLRNPPLTTLVKMTIIFAFPWLKTSKSKNRFFGWEFCGKRIDTTNLIKPFEDALTGIVYQDDSQVVDTRARKIYFREPWVVVKIEEISENFQ